MRFNTFWVGFCASLLLAWVVIFFAGPKIDKICVVTKAGADSVITGKRGNPVTVRKGDRILARECSEFSRSFFARDVKSAKQLRKAVGAQ
jgi:hypothetical protein